MKNLDLSIGRDVQQKLCADCTQRLEKTIGRADILFATTPGGFRRLVKKVHGAVCEQCARIIMSAGRKDL